MRKKKMICTALACIVLIAAGMYILSMNPLILFRVAKGEAKWNVGPPLADGSRSDSAVLSLKVLPSGYKAVVSGTGEFSSPSPGEWGKDLVSLSAGWTVRIRKAEIKDGITAIGDATFSGCESLDEVSIPKSVKKIGILAFAYCDALDHVSYSGTMEEWQDVAERSEGWDEESVISAVRCSDGEIGISRIVD